VASLGFGLSGFAWLWLVAWLLLGCFGLAAAKWLGYWLLASAWLQLSGWAIGFWLRLRLSGLALPTSFGARAGFGTGNGAAFGADTGAGYGTGTGTGFKANTSAGFGTGTGTGFGLVLASVLAKYWLRGL